MSSIIAPKLVTRPESSISRSNPNSNQAKLDRLNTMAQRGPLSQTNQRNLAYLQNKMGVTSPLSDGPNMPRPTDTGMPKATPKGGSQAPQPYNPYDVETLKKLNPNFSDNFGDTSVKNQNTIGAPAPTGPGPGLAGVNRIIKINPTGGPVYGPGGTFSPPGTGGPGMPFGGPTSGPGAPLPQPAGATSTFQNTQSTVNGMPPPNYGSMTMKKGGKVKAKKMASGGMTSKVSSASKRADGIATRGKTKCKMY